MMIEDIQSNNVSLLFFLSFLLKENTWLKQSFKQENGTFIIKSIIFVFGIIALYPKKEKL